MDNHFICPKCRSYLNVENELVFAAKDENGKKGLILLSPKLGDYTVKSNPNYEVRKGSKYEFFCPVCNQELATGVNENLSRVHMVDSNQNEYEVLFSKIAGEKSTYTLIGESLSMYGEHYGNYIDFVNLSNVK